VRVRGEGDVLRISGLLGPNQVDPIASGVASDQPAVGAASDPITDTVTFSAAAREREAAAAQPRSGVLSVAAHKDPKLAEQLAHDYAYIVQGPLYDLTDWNKGILRYSNTGEIVTPESEARYRQVGEGLQAASLKLYNEEKAKGTAPADIYDKLVALGDEQPADLRTVINWATQTG
jgi:hypothetical protein